MHKSYRPAVALAVLSVAGAAHASFTETYDAGTQDVGDWLGVTSTTAFRVIEPTGGNPNGYLHVNESRAVPSWETASTRYQPGFNDEFKRDSVFTGDWTSAGVTSLGVDLNVFGYGSWTEDRALTLMLRGWDGPTDSVSFEATLTIVDLPDPVSPGWNHYDFNIDANSSVIPKGWDVTFGDGTPAGDSDWSTFLHQVDLVSIEYGKPGYFYPSHGVWDMGIDNISINTAAPVPEPMSCTALGLGALALIRRRKVRKG